MNPWHSTRKNTRYPILIVAPFVYLRSRIEVLSAVMLISPLLLPANAADCVAVLLKVPPDFFILKKKPNYLFMVYRLAHYLSTLPLWLYLLPLHSPLPPQGKKPNGHSDMGSCDIFPDTLKTPFFLRCSSFATTCSWTTLLLLEGGRGTLCSFIPY